MGSNPEKDASSENNGPRSVHRALEVLSHVIDSGPLQMSELARDCDLPTSTTLRLLRVLEHWQFVTKNESNLYVPGTRFLRSRLVAEPRESEDLIDASKPVMEKLSELTGESSYLAVQGPADSCVYLREVQSTHPIRYVGLADWAGHTVPMAESAVAEVFENTLGEKGVSIKRAVAAPDALVVAAPITNTSKVPIAALSVVGPSFRMGDEELASIIPTLLDAAGELSQHVRSQELFSSTP